MSDELIKDTDTEVVNEEVSEEVNNDDVKDLDVSENEDIPNDSENLSKEERAIIKHKKGEKALFEENKALKERIKTMETERSELKFEKLERNRIKELVDKGIDETEAKSIAEKERQNAKDRYELNSLRIKNMESKYPGISLYTAEIIELKDKYPEFSVEEIYNAKFKRSNAYDDKIRAEALATKQEAKSKTLERALDDKPKDEFKLSDDDERSYQIWISQNPGGDRKSFFNALYN